MSLLCNTIRDRQLDTRLSRELTKAHQDATRANPARRGEVVSIKERRSPYFTSKDDSASDLERLDLDRRGLTECPNLSDMVKHNLICQLPHLPHLRCLTFLHLYDNLLTDMSSVCTLTSLRVLVLARNRIQRIIGLDNLTKLNMLDLHHNRITKLENVSHLSQLRVLNLLSNRIVTMEKLRGLTSLTELDLTNNHITAVADVERLPRLQRLFLSCNNIRRFDSLLCLGRCCSLCELSLDGNPLVEESCYRQVALCCVPSSLHLLDMKRITEEERRAAGLPARKEDEKKRESHKQAVHKEKRRLAIWNAAQQWEGSKTSLDLPAQNGAKEELSPENSPAPSPAHCPTQTNGIAQEPSPDELRRDRASPFSLSERPAGGSENRLRSSSRPNSPRDPRLQESGGFSIQSLSLSESHVAELDGETVRLFGPGALETLERGWGVQTAGAVTTIAFRYINFDSIVPVLPRIRLKFPNLTHLIFLETNISRLLQLAALAQVRRLEQVTVHPEGNPVVSLTLWRAFLIYRLNQLSLQRINGTEVTLNDVMASERLFGTLGHVASTEMPRCRLLLLLEESRRRQLQFVWEGRGRRAGLSLEEVRGDNGRLLGESLNRALFNYTSRDCSTNTTPEEQGVEAVERASLVQRHLQELVQLASSTSAKAEALHKLWPGVFVEMVRDCVLESRDRAAYRHNRLRQLSHGKTH